MSIYKLIRNDEIIIQTVNPIVWVESELAWLVITEELRTYYCDSQRLMTVEEITEP